jgi:hypothetical protein
MEVLFYNELNRNAINGIEKWMAHISRGDFVAAKIRKVGKNLYRARLNYTDRILFGFYCYNGRQYIIILEYLANHNYARSRFLHNKTIVDRTRFPIVKTQPPEMESLSYLNHDSDCVRFHGKVISFDPIQEIIYNHAMPLILNGAAGSGKTILLLEKLKTLPGKVLYVANSAFLTEKSKELYQSSGYENTGQEVDFLSFSEFLNSIKKLDGAESSYEDFSRWLKNFHGNRIEPRKLYEEFNGVILGSALTEPYLSKQSYLNLGERQSIFNQDDRMKVYSLFLRYAIFLKDKNKYNINLVCHNYLDLVNEKYDYVVIDEVQDLTSVQIKLILKSLVNPSHFLMCGDAHQIIHPNFFSWSLLRNLLYQSGINQNIVHCLQINYRNTPFIIGLANKILMFKNHRFGSIDRESTYLIKNHEKVNNGSIFFGQAATNTMSNINQQVRQSTQYAVIVLTDDNKAEAKLHFDTPLIFSIFEVKGLEYKNIILYDLVSTKSKIFSEIANGITVEEIQRCYEIHEGKLKYNRAEERNNVALEYYKFYINALYVGVTRAVDSLYWLESDTKNPIFDTLQLNETTSLAATPLNQKKSTDAEWRSEAEKLKKLGLFQQAEAIFDKLAVSQCCYEIIDTAKKISESIDQSSAQAERLLPILSIKVREIEQSPMWHCLEAVA